VVSGQEWLRLVSATVRNVSVGQQFALSRISGVSRA